MTERFDTVVVGGGQAGLAIGYYLAQAGRDFLILDAAPRPGESWRMGPREARLSGAAVRGLPAPRVTICEFLDSNRWRPIE